MIVLNAQQLQRLAESLLRLERHLEAEGGDASHVEEGLEDVARRVGVHLEIARLAAPGTLADVASPGERKDHGKLWAVGEVLHLDGLRALAEGKPQEASERLEKARFLLEQVDSGLDLPAGYPPPADRLRTIEELLQGA